MSEHPRRGSLLVVFLTVFIDLLGFGMVLPLLPIYAREFTLDETGVTLGLLAASFSAMQFLCAPFWGRLSDRVGRRPVLMVGLAGSVIFYSVFGLATSLRSLTWMFVSRIGAGIFGATIPTAQAYIADVTPPEQRARGMALIGAAFGLGFTFGPLLAATALLSSGSAGVSPWPGYTAAGLSSGALLLAWFALPESLQEPKRGAVHHIFDWHALRDAVTTPTIPGILAASFLSVLSFANFEAILAYLLKVPPEEGGFGYELIDVLVCFAALGFIFAMAQGVVRSLSRRMSETRMATLGAALAIVGFVLLAQATSARRIDWLMIAVLIESVGFAFIPPSLQSLISRRSAPTQQGGILGIGQSLSSLARISGHAVAFPLFFARGTLPFHAGAVLMSVALVLIVLYVRRGHDYAAETATAEGWQAGLESSASD